MEIDKGAFGQVLKCYDHKEMREVAVKINRNTPFDHNNSRVEIGILKRIKESLNSEDDNSPMRCKRDRIVKINEHFLFRNHYVIYKLFKML